MTTDDKKSKLIKLVALIMEKKGIEIQDLDNPKVQDEIRTEVEKCLSGDNNKEK